MTACTLDFLDGHFEGRCRLLLDEETFQEGTIANCVNALDRIIDPYTDPFRIKVPGREPVTHLLRTAAQRAAGMSSIVSYHENSH